MAQNGINSVVDRRLPSQAILQRTRTSPTESWSSDDIYSRAIRVKTPAVTAGYRQLKKSHSLVRPLPYVNKTNLSYSLWGVSTIWSNRKQVTPWYTIDEGKWRYLHVAGLCSWTYGFPVYGETIAQLKERADKRAVIKLLNKAKDSKFNGAVAFAESKQTSRLIGDFAVTMAKVLKNLRHGDLVSAGRAVGLTIGKRAATRYRKRHKGVKSKDDIDQMLASGVLSIQYGVRPLISDVIGAAELFAQKVVFENLNRVKASSREEFDETVVFKSGATTQTCTRKGFVEVTYASYFAKGSEIVHTLKQLGLTNPALVAWELLPWSFVIDWVFPFGNYLSSLDATLGLDFKAGYRATRLSFVETREQVIKEKPVDYGDWLEETSREKYIVDEFDRIVLAGFPSPSLPSFKNPLSWEHALNGISLLATFKKSVYVK